MNASTIKEYKNASGLFCIKIPEGTLYIYENSDQDRMRFSTLPSMCFVPDMETIKTVLREVIAETIREQGRY